MLSKGKGALPPSPPPKSGGGGGGGTSQSDIINSILQILAPSDTRHDFGKDRPQAENEMTAYEKVLFIPSREFKEEDFCVNSVISEFTMSDKSIHKTENNQYDPYDCAQQNKNDYYKSDFTVKTKTGFDYNVSWGCMKYPQTVDLNVPATRGADGNLTQLEKSKLKTFFDEEVKGSKGVAAGGGAKGEDLNKSGIKEKGFFGKLKEKIEKKFKSSSKKEEGAKGGGEAEDEDEKDDKKEIDAPLFYKLMGLDTTEQIALVIDATSVGLIEILSSGEFPPGTRPDLKYIFTSEVINDPAKKKHPSTFVDNGKGVRWIPCVSTNPVDFVYCYDYIDNDPSNLYLNKFFINKDMRFELSEMKATPVGKTIEYTTNLTIKKFNEDGTIQFIDAQEDSKSKNDISFLTKIIEMLKNAIRSGDVKEFQYAIAFLKKMSGDWLQVLLTLAIENRMRGLKRYGSPGGENLAKNIGRVFFVTHDRIAKAFALTLGCECLFTQTYKPQGKKNSIHSVYLYKKQDEEEVERKTIERANENEVAKKDEIRVSIATLTGDLREYIEKYETEIHGPEMALENAINSHLENIKKITESKSTKVNDINKFVSYVFSSALSLSMTKKTLPDLRGIVMSELTDDFTTLNAIRFPVSTYAEAKDFFKKVGSLETRIKNIGNIIGQSDKLFKTTEVGTSTKVNITEVKKRILEFKKTTVYQSAVNWNWDSTDVTSRILSRLDFNRVETIQDFNSDRHIFLYNIGDIDDKYKQQITRLFFNIYDFINANTDINVYKQDSDAVVLPAQFNKFTTMTNTLCYEIFYFLGGFGDGVGNNSMQISALCDAIKTKFENPRTRTITTISESTLHTEIMTVNLDSGINKSFTEVSNATTEEITGIESAKVAVAAAGGGGSAAATSAEIIITPLGKSNAYLSASSDAVVYKLLTASLFAESSPVEQTEFPNTDPTRTDPGMSMSFFKPSYSRQSIRQPTKQYWGSYTPKILGFFGGLREFQEEYDKGRLKNSNIDTQMENLIKKKPTEITKDAVDKIFSGVKGGSPIPRERINMKGGGDPTNLFDCYLPIYILLIEFRNAIRNEDYEESSDFELILQFYEFLLTMKLIMETKTEEERCTIALGIRDFFFINNVVSKDYQITDVPTVLQNLPSSMLSFTGILTTGFCGVLNEDYFKNVENRERNINNEVFVNFIENVNIPNCFNKSYEYAIGRIVYSELVADVSILIEEVGGKFVKAVEQKVTSVEVDELIKEENKGQEENKVKTMDASSGASSSSSVKNPVLEFNANTGAATSAGGRKTRRRKRTRRPKKQNNKKTRKRRR